MVEYREAIKDRDMIVPAITGYQKEKTKKNFDTFFEQSENGRLRQVYDIFNRWVGDKRDNFKEAVKQVHNDETVDKQVALNAERFVRLVALEIVAYDLNIKADYLNEKEQDLLINLTNKVAYSFPLFEWTAFDKYTKLMGIYFLLNGQYEL